MGDYLSAVHSSINNLISGIHLPPTSTHRSRILFSHRARGEATEYIEKSGRRPLNPRLHVKPQIMCFGGERDLGPPPRPRGPGGRYDPKYVEAVVVEEGVENRKCMPHCDGAVFEGIFQGPRVLLLCFGCLQWKPGAASTVNRSCVGMKIICANQCPPACTVIGPLYRMDKLKVLKVPKVPSTHLGT